MALTKQLSRLSKILVEAEKISFAEAETRLRALTLEIVVGEDATSPASHAATLTAVSVGHRTFVGGVRLVGHLDQPLNSRLPVSAETLGEAARKVGACDFAGAAMQRIVVGGTGAIDDGHTVRIWWHGWRAGTCAPQKLKDLGGQNPLAGIAAAALGVGAAFQRARGEAFELESEFNLWPGDGDSPAFEEVFLPKELWLVGIGNLGQAYLWALSSLPYQNGSDVELVLQDGDRVSEENWGTSVLAFEETYGALKTKTGEKFLESCGFTIRRVDRKLVGSELLEDDEPRIALSGLDRLAPRRAMAGVRFDCIIDGGLGRTAKNFDSFRVSVFDANRTIDQHFEGEEDKPADASVLEMDAYKELEREVGQCGTSEIAGASAAVPYVSALASAIVISRAVAVVSGVPCPRSEGGTVGRISRAKRAHGVQINAPHSKHAGRAGRA